jgi:hypothetical protein
MSSAGEKFTIACPATVIASGLGWTAPAAEYGG